MGLVDGPPETQCQVSCFEQVIEEGVLVDVLIMPILFALVLQGVDNPLGVFKEIARLYLGEGSMQGAVPAVATDGIRFVWVCVFGSVLKADNSRCRIVAVDPPEGVIGWLFDFLDFCPAGGTRGMIVFDVGEEFFPSMSVVAFLRAK